MKRKLFVTIFIILIITISKSVYAEDLLTTDDLDINEYVYFDPESNGICNQGNYWTYYNQDTSCYRWNIIDVSGNNIVIIIVNINATAPNTIPATAFPFFSCGYFFTYIIPNIIAIGDKIYDIGKQQHKTVEKHMAIIPIIIDTLSKELLLLFI